MSRNTDRVNLSVWTTLLLLGAALAVLVSVGAAIWWIAEPQQVSRDALQRLALLAGLCWLLLYATVGVTWLLVQFGISSLVRGREPMAQAEQADEGAEDKVPGLPELRRYLRSTIGLFWRRNVRLLLVLGEPEQIEAIAPTLSGQRWLEGEGVLLLWGGSTQGEPDAALLEQWRMLCPRRPLDGIVWALTPEQSAEPGQIGHGVTHLQKVAQLLRWQAPVHLWQVCASAWSQADRPSEAVGCRLSPHVSAAQLERSLQRLKQPLREQGLAHMQDNPRHDFLLRLARDLLSEGTARWQRALAPLLRARGVILGGLWFSLPLRRLGGGVKNTWQVDPAWRGVLNDKALGGRAHGWTWLRAGSVLLLGLAALWGLGMLLSYFSNRAQIADMQAAVATLEQLRDGDASLRALNELVHALDRLDYRAQ
ncbi:type VI secretion protein VasK, partial [Pseudomonas sp. MOB-449]|nr:type VI secretion protein VasK [Pseudomonas sp. MOB-449]